MPASTPTLTKAELIEEIAEATDLTKTRSELILNTFLESITEALDNGEKVELRGFGSFRLHQRGSRTGRNPRTGDRVDVPAKRIVTFKPGKILKALVNT